MKRDANYYQDRLWAQWNARLDALSERLDGDAFEEEASVLEDDNAVVRITRIGLHFNEARAIIQTLLENPTPIASDKQYQVIWADRVPGAFERGTAPPMLEGTRAELLKRLHWISSEAYGEDLEEWRQWLSAFEEDTPLPYSR